MSRPPQKKRCKVTRGARGQKLKPHWAMHGQEVCGAHGGRAPQNKRAAENRVMVMKVVDKAHRMIARAGIDATPEEILWDNLCLAVAKRNIWGQMVADLDHAGELELQQMPDGQRGWARKVWVPPSRVGGKGHFITEIDPVLTAGVDKYHIHPFLEEEKHWIQECRQMAKDCIVLGLKEREVRMAERQGQAVVQLIRAVLADPGWSEQARAELKAKGGAIAARHLRLLESKEAI